MAFQKLLKEMSPEKFADSAYFDRVFKGSFKEALESKLELDDVTKEQFDLVIQWIYAGSLKYDSPPEIAPSALLSKYITFTRLVDRFDLCGDIKPVYEEVLRIFSDNGHDVLTAEHIRDALKLPVGHDVRNAIVKNCAIIFLDDYQFRFEKELVEIQGFSNVLFLVLKACIQHSSGGIRGSLSYLVLSPSTVDVETRESHTPGD
ncbi:hypothetical protein M7I_0753 [Glarea lozoyensis 74030]|uniref:BTB domain-containing protein n=1 Tax=Glarea lozoyensis (strain ATCC 74030 / MF5533) TaxID=1104152 RepID=H0EE81_GLAL7|nr:hypothetical protein M7I_0753 [Glarea lozoyensis 74030]